MERQSFAIGATMLAVMLAAGEASAVPRYSARYEQNCNLCHENPTGGGIRSTYASKWLVPSELSWKQYGEEELATIAPQLSDVVTLGFDWRTQYHWEQGDGLPTPIFETSYKNFFQMEGNLYLSVQLDPRFSAHVTRGMSSTTEIYGLGYVLPGNGYVKAGRFMPAYGWRYDDHTAFVRHHLGFRPPGTTDVGLEVGFHPGRFQIVGSVTNGNTGGVFDTDEDHAVSGMGLYRGKLGRLGFGVGGSAMRNETATQEDYALGPLGYLKFDRFTWTGEADWVNVDPAGPPGTTESLATSHEFAMEARRGLDLLATFDFYDPDLDLKSGARIRYGLGAEFTPRPFLTLRGSLNMYRPDTGPALGPLGFETEDFTMGEVQLHLFY